MFALLDPPANRNLVGVFRDDMAHFTLAFPPPLHPPAEHHTEGTGNYDGSQPKQERQRVQLCRGGPVHQLLHGAGAGEPIRGPNPQQTAWECERGVLLRGPNTRRTIPPE